MKYFRHLEQQIDLLKIHPGEFVNKVFLLQMLSMRSHAIISDTLWRNLNRFYQMFSPKEWEDLATR